MKTFKKLFRLSREEWPLLAQGMLYLAISSAALLVYPNAIKKIIDDALVRKDYGDLNQAALLALGVFVIQSVTSALRYYFFTIAGEKTVKRLRARLFHQIIGQEVTFFDQQKTGELLGRLSSDTGSRSGWRSRRVARRRIGAAARSPGIRSAQPPESPGRGGRPRPCRV